MNHLSALDISPLWSHSHAHLRPFADLPPLAGEPQRTFDVRTCGWCGGGRVVSVVARLCFAEAAWQEAAHIDFCPDCARYSVTNERAQGYRAALGLAAHVLPTAVDARLWSRTPTFLNIEPTTRCNFSCWYCVGRDMQQEDITVENFVRALDRFPTVKAIALVGEGEPLMHTGFFTMAKIAVERGIRVLISSNGSTLSSANVQKLCESGVAYVSISIDSADPATFARSRIDGKLEQVLSGVRRLADFRDRNGYRYPRIGLKGTLFAETLDELPAIAALAHAHGVEYFESMQTLNPMRTYVPIYPAEHLGELNRIEAVGAAVARDTAQALTILKPVGDFCAAEGIPASNIGRPNGLRPNCDEEWIFSSLAGDVTPCCQLKTAMDPAWNLFHHPIDAILADHRYENLRFNLWNGLFPADCQGCWKIRSAA